MLWWHTFPSLFIFFSNSAAKLSWIYLSGAWGLDLRIWLGNWGAKRKVANGGNVVCIGRAWSSPFSKPPRSFCKYPFSSLTLFLVLYHKVWSFFFLIFKVFHNVKVYGFFFLFSFPLSFMLVLISGFYLNVGFYVFDWRILRNC